MRPLKIRALSVLLGACYCLTVGSPVYADDTEIFGTGGTVGAGLKPNILFIVDTSGSMATQTLTHATPYDPAITYAGTCNANNVFWRNGLGTPPLCTTTQQYPLSQNMCATAVMSRRTSACGIRPSGVCAGRTCVRA
jgi:hypothetical protein